MSELENSAAEEIENELASPDAVSGGTAPASVETEDAENQADAEPLKPSAPAQSEMPFAIVQGKVVTELPKDLYIPPDALEVILEAFEGPLDLLLYLIRRQNLDILEIDVSEITHQYVAYVELMESMQFELAAEYLVMAAMLAEIKSRMLLPRSQEMDEEEEDPRAMLIRRLQEYERFKQAAEDIDEIPRLHRDLHVARAAAPDRNLTRPDPDVEMRELLLALSEVLRRADMFESHHVEKERLSTRERMAQVLDRLRGQQFVPFVSLFTVHEGRLGVVVTFLAVMELIKETLVEIVQTEPFGPIHVKARVQNVNEHDADLAADDSEEFEGDTDDDVYADSPGDGDADPDAGQVSNHDFSQESRD